MIRHSISLEIMLAKEMSRVRIDLKINSRPKTITTKYGIITARIILTARTSKIELIKDIVLLDLNAFKKANGMVITKRK